MEDATLPEVIETIIRSRKTEKVLCDIESRKPIPAEVAARNRLGVLQSLKTAGWAPFHYPRNVAGVAEPWRAHVLWDDEVRNAAIYLRDELNTTSKEPKLAAGCSALVLVTWLPESHDQRSQNLPESNQEVALARDEEHLAAAAAMVQNLLLLLTARGMGTYWSSGGKFREPEMFGYLNIPRNERLLAAVFIEYPEMMDKSKERTPGKLRDKRSEAWIREVSL